MKKAFTLLCCALFCLNTISVFAQEKTVNQKVSQGSARDPQLLITTSNLKPAISTVYPKGFESGAEFQKLFQTGGPYDYINPAAEILDKRDLTTKHFQTSDNKIITIASAGPVHYKKNGLWNTILNGIESNTQFANFGFANTHNRFQTFYGNSLQGGIKILTEQNEELNLMQEAGIVYLDKNFHETGNAGLLHGAVQHVQENFIGYENLYNGVNAVVEHNAAGYELNYEIQNLSSIQIPANTEFVSFREGISVPSGCHAITAEDNKGIYVQDNHGRTLLRYKLPVFYEKNDPTSNESRLNGNYFTEEKNGKVYINVLVPVKWITDPRHQFPLVIDPVVTVTPQNVFAWTFTVDEDAGCDYSTDNDQDDNLRVGFDDGTIDNDYYQCYAKYDISSIPDANCIQSAYVSFYEYNWNNPRNDDNQLDFYFQAYDPIGSDPVPLTCDQNYADIDATGTVYRQYNVWGNCGGACTDFDETPNQWKNFPDNVSGRVSACLAQNFVVFSLDKFNNSHPDPGLSLFNCGLCGNCGFFCCSCTPNNDEWIDFRGYSDANRPQLVITHDAPYVAATSISGTSTICAGSSTTLTRVGGTTGGGGAWRWYTGSCGGTLAGSGDNITVSPATTTTYYLRGEGTCGNTACVSVTVTVQSVSVAPTSISGTSTICTGASTTLTESGGTLGTGAVYNWYTGSCGGTFIGSGASITVSPLVNTTYYVRAQGTCNTTGCASVTVTVNTPSTSAGAIAGTSTICSGGNTTLSVSGGSLGTGANWQWYTGSCGGASAGSGASITVSPASTTIYYVRAVGTCNTTACVQLTVTVNTSSTAPTSITPSPAVICNGSSSTLSVVGGSLGTGATWQWYSGSCGGTPVGSGASITVSPSSTTTYYVRAEGTCNTTGCASTTITVNQPSTDPFSISGTTTICNGTLTTLSVVGGSLGTGAIWQWYTASCGGASAGSGSSITVSPATTTTYYVRAVGTCNTTNCVSVTVTVNQLSTAPTSISGTSLLCNGDNTLLSVVGGSLGTGANWQWYSGSCGGTSVGNGTSVNVNPATTTTYFVRAEGTCNNTICVQITVTVNQPSVAPTAISGTITVCNGISTTLSVVGGSLGTGGNWQWYSASCGGTAAGSGTSITVSPSSTTNYFVRAEGTCNTTSCAFTTVTVQDTSIAAISVSGAPAICIGSSTNLSVVGGSLGTSATWEWYNGSCGGTHIGSGAVLTNVSPAITTDYYVRAEGLCNTTICTPFTLTVNPLPNGSISGSTQVCAGVDTVLTFNFATGTAPFDVIYTDGTNVFTKIGVNDGDTIRELAAGTTTYSVQQITDANGCVRTSGFLGAATITVAPLPVISNIFISDVLCNGGNTGSITLTASSGTPAFNYSIDNGTTYQVGNSFSGLTAGTYFPLVSDAKNCSSPLTNGVQVNEPTVLDHTNVVQNASCDNVFDGSITVNAIGGVTPYSYSLNGGPTQLGNLFSGLLAGNYVVQVVDFNGCTDTSHVAIDTAYGVHASIVSQTDVSCFGGVDGTVTVQLTGGVPPYSYSINGVQFVASPTFVGLASSNYVVTLRDSKGCTDFANVTIIQPNLLQAFVDSTQSILCNGGTTGAIFITVTGGNGGYNFVWSNGAVTEDITGITAGTYNVAITDSKGCSASTGATISQPLPLFVNIASFHNLNCNSDNTGSVDITVNGGVPPYTFAWSNGASTEDVYGLSGGVYDVTVTDVNGCSQTASQTLTEPTVLTSTISPTNVSCNGAADGQIDLSVTGGTIPYNFIWSNGVTSEDLANIAGGTYTVVVHDANGCSISNSVTITEAPALVLTTSVTNILCNGALTGAIDLAVSGGVPVYTFAWSNGTFSEDISSVVAGNYSVTVTDNVGCSASTSAIISEPTALTIVLAGHADVSCNGGNNGSIDINIFGGTPLYSYTWTNGATSEDLNAIIIGTYSVTVSDANSCTATFTTTISEPTAITSTLTKTDVTCPGASNGSADLTVSGGVNSYTYLWSNGATSEDLTNVTGGTYTVIITDLNNCTAANSITINEGLPLTISGVVTDVLCNGGSTGSIVTTISGGIPAYTYNWSNSTTTPDLNNISAGNYSVTVSDVNSCSASASFVVTQPAGLVVSATTVDVGCAGGSNGSIDITVYGGVFAYTYNWSNAAIIEDLHNISGGNYDVTITDANLCTLTATYTIAEPSAIVSSTTHTDVSCHGADDATANLTVSGGTSPYTFFWSNFLATQNVTGLHGGLYFVVITDANGCEKRDSALIAEPIALQFDSVVTKNISCNNANDGAIHVYVSGGTLPYVYNWSDGTHADSLTSLANGTYSVTVLDAHSCVTATSVTIVNPSAITANFISQNPLCAGDANGSIDLIPTGGLPGYTFVWSNGATTEDISGLIGGVYSVTITDSKGCITTGSKTIVDPPGFSISEIQKNITCHNYNNGSILTSAFGGTPPYTYYWVDSITGQNITNGPFIDNLAQGDYWVTTTDANGCLAVGNYPLVNPPQLTSHIDVTDATCFGTNSGSIKAVVLGGIRPYHYLWNNFAVDSFQQAVAAGHYVVQVIDTNGCFLYDSININQPTEILVAGITTNVVCYGDSTGGVTLTVIGGVPGYTFAWSNGTANQDLTAVVAGTYNVITTDTNGCSKTNSFTLMQGVKIIPSLATLNPICHGGSTGSITAIVSGGVQPYSYAWSNLQTSVAIGALHAGDYTLTLTDAASCSVSSSVTLIDPVAIDVTSNASASKCFNTATGGVVTTITGGTAPYTFLLNGVAQDSGTFTGLLPGNYLVLVTDVNGCQGNSNFTVNTPGQISVSVVSAEQVILTGMETQLTATTTTDSNSTVLHYFWEPDTSVFNFRDCLDLTNCNKPYVAPKTTTTFTVTVMSSDSCYASDTVTVQVLRQPSAFIPTAFTPNNDELNDCFEFDILGAKNIDIVIFNRWGSKVYSNPSQENKITGRNGWDGMVNGKLAPYDTYVYQMKVLYWDDTVTDFTGTVTLMK